MKTAELLKELSNVFGPVSYEGLVYDKIEELMKKEYPNLDYTRTKSGNLIVKFGEGKKKIAFFAHADEIGVVVSKIENEHFVRVTNVGGVDPRTLIAKRIKFKTRNGFITGVCGMLAPHLQSAATKGKSPSFDQVFVDLTLAGGTKNIEVGDMGVIETETIDIGTNFVTGKALDNRVGCVVLMKALDYLQDYKFNGELYLVFNKAEEVGGAGARTASELIKPDFAIIVDVTFANENAPTNETYKLGDGVTIAIGAPIYQGVYQSLTDIATEAGIKFAVEPAAGSSGTDTDMVQLSCEGVKTGLVSVPLANMHSPVEVVSIKDVESAAKLLALFAMKEGRDK